MNKPLILATLDTIEANLPRWLQDTFADTSSCGTTACFAGWALINSGYTLDEQANFVGPHGSLVDMRDIEPLARQLLGFNYTQSDRIFYWFPEDHMPELGRLVTKQDEFEVFKVHALRACGITE